MLHLLHWRTTCTAAPPAPCTTAPPAMLHRLQRPNACNTAPPHQLQRRITCIAAPPAPSHHLHRHTTCIAAPPVKSKMATRELWNGQPVLGLWALQKLLLNKVFWLEQLFYVLCAGENGKKGKIWKIMSKICSLTYVLFPFCLPVLTFYLFDQYVWMWTILKWALINDYFMQRVIIRNHLYTAGLDNFTQN